ncbi:XopG/HopH/AvrPtoH family type III secretion system effector [Paracidovorax oryzae]|uniref:XopG/HopH/AvrPtoH family type III secretion system effector n=1 Tax=Paracidovorax oryzae TaxID=862720 RepID=UPI0002FFBE19|nr:XopG/HopH/AvrPtoH family type III secretion system effector [Paracidovorax oryzae]
MDRYPSIRVGASTSSNFKRDVKDALEKIDSRPSGSRLLQQIEGLATREKTVTIVEAGTGQAPVATPRLTPSQWQKLGSSPDQSQFEAALLKNAGGSNWRKTRGTASEIPWNKYTAEPDVDSRGVPIEGANPANAFITLAHELVHAKHHLAGTMMHGGGPVTRDPSSARTDSGKEELRAVGLGEYASTREPSENSIRAEHGLPQRTTYARAGTW